MELPCGQGATGREHYGAERNSTGNAPPPAGARLSTGGLVAGRDDHNRPLDGVYAAIFIDAIMVKVLDGQVANRPIYAAIGVSLAGEKDVLGLWAGDRRGGCEVLAVGAD